MKTTLTVAEDSALKITYGALVFFASCVVGFTLWLGSIQNRSYANSKDVEEVHEKVKKLDDVVRGIDNKLATIEGYIKASSRKRRGD